MKSSHDPSKKWVAKEANSIGLHVNAEEAQTIADLNKAEKLENTEFIVQLAAFFYAEKSIPVMIFPHYKSDLFDFTSTGPMSIELASNISRQLLDILGFLERKELIHRDIKSENVLLGDNLKVRLGDFGTAIWKNKPTKQSMGVTGTIKRLSPELVNWVNEKTTPSPPPYDFNSDVWALGGLLYDLVNFDELFPVNECLPPEEKIVEITRFHSLFPSQFEEKLSTIPEIDGTTFRTILIETLKTDPTERLPASKILDLIGPLP